jgi:hypothetical protein
MIRSFRSNLATVHLNDNFGISKNGFSDLHLFPGEGSLLWEPIFRALKEIRFSGVMNVEPIANLPHMMDAQRQTRLADGLNKLSSSSNAKYGEKIPRIISELFFSILNSSAASGYYLPTFSNRQASSASPARDLNIKLDKHTALVFSGTPVILNVPLCKGFFVSYLPT